MGHSIFVVDCGRKIDQMKASFSVILGQLD
uniref:Uncharacterized protein n=1 Tax=Ackermannviridae sp. ctUml7 TaxID=2825753 RepID=A0A8S5VA21_9CAUD|nr:MAG TPA: hypothetical protein [Ackermannviridae sp. ctUml7]